MWQQIRREADGFVTPGQGEFADPATIDQAPATVKSQVVAHTYGRRLTRWLETLGFAWQLTGDARYSQHGVAILLAAAARIPVSDPRVAGSFAGARGDIMRALALGLDWLGDALTPEQRRTVAAVAADYVRNLLAESKAEQTWWRPYHNFMGVAGGAAGCLSLVLQPDFPAEAPQWRAECTALVRTWLEQGFDDQGAYYEGTMYGLYGLSNGLLFADALARNGGPDLFDHPHLAVLSRFYALELLPGDKVFDARNDANYSGVGDPCLLTLARHRHDGLARWVWDQAPESGSPLRIIWDAGAAPVAPPAARVPLAQRFVGRGLAVFRTGWTAADVMFSIEAGPYHKVTHNQGDKGHFTLYGLGHHWAIDSGYGNTRLPDGRDQTVAHNQVLIDGQGQALSGAGAGTDGQLLGYTTGERSDWVLADATAAYNRNSAGQAGAGVQRAWRHAVWVHPRDGAPAYAVVADDLAKDAAPHAFTWLLHTDSGNVVQPQADGAWISPQEAAGVTYLDTPYSATAKGAASWRVTLPAGQWRLWARVRAGGDEVSKSDSFVVQVDDGELIQWHMPGSRGWLWGQVANGVDHRPCAFDLPAGEHRLRFLTRESGAQVAAIVFAPEGANPPFDSAAGVVRVNVAEAQVREPMRLVVVAPQPTPRLRVVLHAAAPVQFSVDAYDGHPRLRATTQTAAPGFVAVLLPLPAGVAEPQVEFGERTVKVVWPGRTDRITWPAAGVAEAPQVE